jgi:hypothetical protein
MYQGEQFRHYEKRPLLAVSISWKRCCRYSNVSGRVEGSGSREVAG